MTINLENVAKELQEAADGLKERDELKSQLAAVIKERDRLAVCFREEKASLLESLQEIGRSLGLIRFDYGDVARGIENIKRSAAIHVDRERTLDAAVVKFQQAAGGASDSGGLFAYGVEKWTANVIKNIQLSAEGRLANELYETQKKLVAAEKSNVRVSTEAAQLKLQNDDAKTKHEQDTIKILYKAVNEAKVVVHEHGVQALVDGLVHAIEYNKHQVASQTEMIDRQANQISMTSRMLENAHRALGFPHYVTDQARIEAFVNAVQFGRRRADEAEEHAKQLEHGWLVIAEELGLPNGSTVADARDAIRKLRPCMSSSDFVDATKFAVFEMKTLRDLEKQTLILNALKKAEETAGIEPVASGSVVQRILDLGEKASSLEDAHDYVCKQAEVYGAQVRRLRDALGGTLDIDKLVARAEELRVAENKLAEIRRVVK